MPKITVTLFAITSSVVLIEFFFRLLYNVVLCVRTRVPDKLFCQLVSSLLSLAFLFINMFFKK